MRPCIIVQVPFLRHSYQLNVKDECGATGNARLGVFAVAHLGRDVKLPLVSNVHLLKGDDPSVYQVAQSHGNRRAAPTAVELPAVDGPAGVVNGDDASSLGLCPVMVTLLQHFIIDAFGERFHTLQLWLYPPTTCGWK